MSKVVKGVKTLFKGPRMPASIAAPSPSAPAPMTPTQAVTDTSSALRDEERRVEATAEGQRRARRSNRGLLAFIDDALGLTFGGG